MKLAILDMGAEEYGDCLFLENGGVTVLIDGGHPGDFDGQPGVTPLPDQIAAEAGGAPINVDLLVVTHSHADHIGCLPKMVEKKKLRAKFALVSDPDHRWGKPAGAVPDASPAITRAIDLLGEEVPPLERFASADQLRAYLDARATLQESYREMIDTLRDAGTKVTLYAGPTSVPAALKTLLGKAGLTLLGPTKTHLLLCAKRLEEQRTGTQDALRQDAAALADAPDDYFEIYSRLSRRQVLADVAWEVDAVSKKFKGAINDLSIVFALKLGSAKVLLSGDMQFADPEVAGLEDDMVKLLKKVEKAGPYGAVKLPHHTSYNGWDEALHTTRLPAKLLVHSGGRNDPDHPEKKTLDMLKNNAAGRTFLRTDRNGIITLEPDGTGLKFSIKKGAKNDYTRNVGSDVSTPSPAGTEASSKATKTETTVVTQTAQGDLIRISAEIPNRRTRVVLTVDIVPGQTGGTVDVTSEPAGEKKN